jgi:hypothetical protein
MLVSPALCAALLSLSTAAPVWSVDPSHALAWQGVPEIPVGLRIAGTPDAIDQAAAAGIDHLVVELPANGIGWPEALDKLKANGQNFFIAISSAAPAAEAIFVDPAGNRRPDITSKVNLSFKIPAATGSLALLASLRDGEPTWHKKIAAVDGVINVEADAYGLRQVLLLYPTVRTLAIPDFWEGFDTRRDELVKSIKTNELGDGFRGIINPLGEALRFPGEDQAFVPTSPLFRYELESILAKRYRTVKLATKAWSMGPNDIESLQHMSRLVPLWRGTRGVPRMWDPATDKLYMAAALRSAAWRDIQDAVKATMNRRMTRLTEAVRTASGGPVIQDWVGWDGPYDGTEPGLDGIGARVSARTILEAVDSASQPVSSSLQWQKPGLMIASEITLSAEGERAPLLESIAQELESMGVRGLFFRAHTPDQVKETADLAAAWKGRKPEMPPRALFFPLAAHNPCNPSRAAPGVWWLPRREEGQLIHFGAGLLGYRYQGSDEDFLAIWSTIGPQRVKMKAIESKKFNVRSLDGSDPDFRPGRKDFKVNVSGIPLIFDSPHEIPAPISAFEETTVLVERLINSQGKLQRFFDGQELDFINAAKAWDDHPGSSLISMTMLLQEMAPVASPFLWLEPERVREHNFSSVIDRAGASGGQTLSLSTMLPPGPDGYKLRFEFTPREPGLHEVWVAGRIPADQRSEIAVSIARDLLHMEDRPLGPYGDGLAWYRLGESDLPEGQHEFELMCESDSGARLELDVIVVAPKGWRPQGSKVPINWIIDLPGTGSDGPPSQSPKRAA